MPVPLRLLALSDARPLDPAPLLDELRWAGFTPAWETAALAGGTELAGILANPARRPDLVLVILGEPGAATLADLHELFATERLDQPVIIVAPPDAALGRAALALGAVDWVPPGQIERLARVIATAPQPPRPALDATGPGEAVAPAYPPLDAAARYRTLVEQLPAVTYITSLAPELAVVSISPQLESLLGFRPEEWIGQSDVWLEHTHPDDRERITAADDRSNETLEPFVEEYRMVARDGRIVWVYDSCVLVRDRDGTPLYWQGVIMDVTARKSAEEELRRLAVTDPLTGLPNRTLFSERLERALERSRGASEEVAILFVDLDHFKHVNDSLGHAAGDRLLVEASRRLLTCCRANHTLARFGGDEFALLIEGAGAGGEAQEVADRLIAALRPPFAIEGGEAFVGGSVGIAIAARHRAAGELLREADIALYEAKSLGRGRTVVFEPVMNERAIRRLEQETALRRAVERNELELRFQPVVDLHTGVPHGCEALVRWRHPDQGVLAPGEFLALAEETGLIVPVGEWVLEMACRAAAAWPPNLAGEAPFVAVNVSARQLRDPAFGSTLWRVLAESGLAPGRLTLEVTEHALIEDAEATSEFLTTLRTLGVRLALDDFGTGYSSLGQLHRLAIDQLKIDRSFVAGVAGDRHCVAIVRAVAELARELDLQVTAEGIETAEQRRLARELGCHTGQGYFFGPAVLPADVPTYLRDGGQRNLVQFRRG